MKNVDPDICMTYSPYIYFDHNEPFFPEKVGVSILDKPSSSPSFARSLSFDHENLDFIIEYTYYWDFDIQHLYELEHVWVYVGKDGSVIDCEASTHGKYLKGLLSDRSNLIDDTHVKLYSQPGKHAFSPIKELFELLPDLYTCTGRDAGKMGLLVNELYKGVIHTDREKDRIVYEYLQTQRFTPSLEFQKHEIPRSMYLPWEQLKREIPGRISYILSKMGKS